VLLGARGALLDEGVELLRAFSWALGKEVWLLQYQIIESWSPVEVDLLLENGVYLVETLHQLV
jgi:hypothetical protein